MLTTTMAEEQHGDMRRDTDHRLQELAQALENETQIVGALGDALCAQRAAVGADDTAAVNESVQTIGRIVLTLSDARSLRRALVSSLGGDSANLDALEPELGRPLPARLEDARARLRRAAMDAGREAAINQVVLRRALEAGEAFVHSLFSADADAGYQPERPPAARTGAGVILNRKA